jgi:hypothetical protein
LKFIVNIKQDQMVMSAETVVSCDGQVLKDLAYAGLQWLESNHQHVNELNVFPVPDGDTGTNMLLTMQNAYREVAEETSVNSGHIIQKIAHGAMMGSRGNSGTILSQLWLGFARILNDIEHLDAMTLAKGLREATETAYRGVQRPVEGTILTVAREITEEIEALVEETDNLLEILESMVKAGWKSVQRTPELLSTLKKAGVVDSGGTGLLYILEGMLRYIKDEPVALKTNSALTEANLSDEIQIEHPGENIYDVQFVIKRDNLNASAIKAVMEQMGDSVVVVGTDSAVKVHVHVRNPGIPLEYAANVGPISDIVVENMLEQYEAYLVERLKTTPATEALEFEPVEPGQIAVVAVAAGPGMAKVFRDLGVAGVVNGGQTNNPSTQEFLEVIRTLSTNRIILLPNNKNIILTAQQVAQIASDYQIKVVPTRTFPQGVGAMLKHDLDGDLDEVYQAMTEESRQVITAEITHATRTVELEGVSVKEGQIIGLLNGQLTVAGESIREVVQKLLGQIETLDEMELVTCYYGDTLTETDTQTLMDELAEQYDALEFQAVFGGQSHYPLVISVE